MWIWGREKVWILRRVEEREAVVGIYGKREKYTIKKKKQRLSGLSLD